MPDGDKIMGGQNHDILRREETLGDEVMIKVGDAMILQERETHFVETQIDPGNCPPTGVIHGVMVRSHSRLSLRRCGCHPEA
jgi:hypothetical protein